MRRPFTDFGLLAIGVTLSCVGVSISALSGTSTPNLRGGSPTSYGKFNDQYCYEDEGTQCAGKDGQDCVVCQFNEASGGTTVNPTEWGTGWKMAPNFDCGKKHKGACFDPGGQSPSCIFAGNDGDCLDIQYLEMQGSG